MQHSLFFLASVLTLVLGNVAFPTTLGFSRNNPTRRQLNTTTNTLSFESLVKEGTDRLYRSGLADDFRLHWVAFKVKKGENLVGTEPESIEVTLSNKDGSAAYRALKFWGQDWRPVRKAIVPPTGRWPGHPDYEPNLGRWKIEDVGMTMEKALIHAKLAGYQLPYTSCDLFRSKDRDDTLVYRFGGTGPVGAMSLSSTEVDVSSAQVTHRSEKDVMQHNYDDDSDFEFEDFSTHSDTKTTEVQTS